MTALVDTGIIIALALSIAYNWTVNRRIHALTTYLRDLGPAISAFSDAVDRSADSATDLRTAAHEIASERDRIRPGADDTDRPADRRKQTMVRDFFASAGTGAR